jgi:hypothetical protein
MRDIVLVCPQPRDLAAVRATRLDARFRVRLVGDDLDALDHFDAAALLEEAASRPADGVVATRDRSALLAALAARRLGLPGPSPEALLACQHKPTSRAIQQRVAPEATPAFAEVAGGRPAFPPPWFVKPVVGRLSQDARRVDDPRALAGLAAMDEYRRGYASIAALAGFPASRVRGHLAEELRSGVEVTLEGFSHRGAVTVVGITDSVKYPGTNSFERFEYPSGLAPARREELARLAEAVVRAHGLDGGFFNVEFLVPEEGPAALIELNGRLASQFAPLVQAVHGRSTYEALFALACGDDPAWAPGPPRGAAVSYVLRHFEDAYVSAAPEPEEGVEVLVRPGRNLSEHGANDVDSYRLAIVYAAGGTPEEALAAARSRAARLTFRLETPRAPAAARP